MRCRRRQRGLTLLEVAILLAVLAVLASLAVPVFGARLDRQRVQGAAGSLAADVAEARFEAARRGRALYVQAEPGADWCWSVSASPDCGCGRPLACQIHTVHAGDHRGVRLIDGLAVRLDPAGGMQSPQAAVLETARGERLRVEVSPLGRPRVCASRGAWTQLPAC